MCEATCRSSVLFPVPFKTCKVHTTSATTSTTFDGSLVGANCWGSLAHTAVQMTHLASCQLDSFGDKCHAGHEHIRIDRSSSPRGQARALARHTWVCRTKVPPSPPPPHPPPPRTRARTKRTFIVRSIQFEARQDFVTVSQRNGASVCEIFLEVHVMWIRKLIRSWSVRMNPPKNTIVNVFVCHE